ncbi:ADP-ribosylglycohydrolase family protein [Microbacterium sp.]
MLLAAAAGDALGWPQEPRGGLVGGRRAREARRPRAEFTAWERTSGSQFQRYRERVEAGEYSDDTQLMLAVARACLHGTGWARHLAEVELASWPVYQRGGGRAVLRASRSWAKGGAPWSDSSPRARATSDYREAGANGVAMRIAPHVLYTLNEADPQELFRRVIVDGVTTHGHPRALVGAITLSGALRYALTADRPVEPIDLLRAANESFLSGAAAVDVMPNGWFTGSTRGEVEEREAFASLWDSTNDEMRGLLEIGARSIRRASMSNVTETLSILGADGAASGSGTVSVAAAIYLAGRSGTRPESGLLQAAFESGIDTDTVAAMTGALLGGIHGTAWIGALARVQDGDYIEKLALELVARSKKPSTARRPTDREFFEQLDRDVADGLFADGRRYRIVRVEEISRKPWVRRHHLLLEDGQTALVDRVRRSEPEWHQTPLPAPLPPTNTLGFVVTLPASDLRSTRVFYELALDQKLTDSDGRLQVSDHLVFVPMKSALEWTPDARLRFGLSSSAFANVRSRFEDLGGGELAEDVLTLKDPDGRTVTVVKIL